ncbi:MAG: hypothetical protein Q9182_005628 [Xanthomendoza sp. 2 TL-2023]
MDATFNPARSDLSRSESRQPLQEMAMPHPLAAIERYYASAEAGSDALRLPYTKPPFMLEMQKPTSGSQSAGSSIPEKVDEGTLLESATHRSRNQQDELGWRDVARETELAADDGPPRDIAYESLARNLGARFLTPKSSQVWRGGETRKASLSGFPGLIRSGSG